MSHRSKVRGFTLIELFLAIAILGILAYIAIPAYNDYILTSQTNEAMQTASGWQKSIEAYHTKNGTWPTATDLDNERVATNFSNRFAAHFAILKEGVIEIVFDGPMVNPALSGRKLDLLPFAGPNGEIFWKCGTGKLYTDYLPEKFRPYRCKGLK